MENWEAEKHVPLATVIGPNESVRDDLGRKISENAAVEGKLKKSRPRIGFSEAEQKIDLDENGQNWKRKGISEWKIDNADVAHLGDASVYGIEENQVGPSSSITPIYYEVTQERDRTLYEKACCSSDVLKVWNQISHYIRSSLRKGVGVTIPGLCTITTALTKRNSVHEERFVLKRKPLLSLSKILVNRYKLIDQSDQVFGFRVPASLINLSEIGAKTNLSRSIVEGIVTEVLQTFARALVCDKPIEFPFPLIGKLQVRNQCSVMRFYSDFCDDMNYDYVDMKLVSRSGIRLSNTSATSKQSIINSNSGMLRSMFARKGTPYHPPQSQSGASGKEDDSAEVLTGQMTPINRHVPSESFRSVFHLRQVRSVSEIITVTAEDLRRIDCLEMTCKPIEEKTEIPAYIAPGFVLDKDDTPPEYVWCPPPEPKIDAATPGPVVYDGEEEGEHGGEGYIAKWIRQARRVPPYVRLQKEYQGEFLGEEATPPVPPPSIHPEFDEEYLGEMSPKSPLQSPGEKPPQAAAAVEKIQEPELEPPCHHTFYPKPLYTTDQSGNFVTDMIVPDKVHFDNFLFNHHYRLCQKMVGLATVKKHFGGKVTSGKDACKSFYF